MKKIFVYHILIVAVFLMLFISLNSYALDYTIAFAGKNASDMVDSVIVQNLTQGTTVTVPAGNGLTLKEIPNSIDQLLENEQTVRVFLNSARDKSIVLFFAKQSGSTLINVFGIDGKRLVGISKDLSVGENSFQLSLPKGVYAIRIAGNGYSYAAKVIGQANSVSKPEIDFLGNKETEFPVSSKIRNNVQLKTSSATTEMLYTEGDHLLFQGASGFNKTIVTDVPTQSKTITFNFVDCTDADNNHYPVVQIGTQVWMAENLKTTKYNDGTSIPTVSFYAEWQNLLTTPAYCFFKNDASYKNIYGALYNWYTVNTGKLAPTDWHVPTDVEWTILENYLIANGYNYDGTTTGNKIAKSLAATANWHSDSGTGLIGDNLTKNNTSGFTGLPCGYRGAGMGGIYKVDSFCYWWSSTQSNTSDAWLHYMFDCYNYVIRNNSSKPNVWSVRCLRDDPTPVLGAPTLSTTAANNIKATSATGGGIITSDGGAAIIARGVCWSTSPYPTTANSKTIDGIELGSFTSSITDLTANTLYYFRAYATNSIGTSYGNIELFTTEGPVTDIDGNIYTTVTIGTQTWMVENLKTTKYNDGTSIPLLTAGSDQYAPGYCFYNNDAVNKNTYGALYNWYAVSTGKLAPIGWRVPSPADWTTLTTYLTNHGYGGSGSDIAKSMASTSGWISNYVLGTVGNDQATNNSSGFTGLPAGKYFGGAFYDIGNSCMWWSTMNKSNFFAYNCYMYSGSSNVTEDIYDKPCGLSVRCVKN